MRGHTTLYWAVALACLTSVLTPSTAPGDIHGRCDNCGAGVLLSKDGVGFARHWIGLCGKCKKHEDDCKEARAELKGRPARAEANLADWEDQLKANPNSQEAKQNVAHLSKEVDALNQALKDLNEDCGDGGGDGNSDKPDTESGDERAEMHPLEKRPLCADAISAS